MNTDLRKLHSEDLPQIQDLLNDQHRLFRRPKKEGSNERYFSAIRYRLSQPPEHFVLYGLFMNGVLMSIAAGLFGRKMPIWTLCYMHARQSDNNLYCQTTGQVVDAVIEEAESRGIYRFDYITALRQINYIPEKHYSRLSRFSEKAKRYEYFTEALIPKNTRPAYEYQWWMLGEREPEMDMVIRTAELREEYRTEMLEKVREAMLNLRPAKREESFLLDGD